MKLPEPAATLWRKHHAAILSGQVKSGHLWTPQIRPFPAPRDGS